MNSVAEDYAREIDHWARVYGGHGWMIAPADLYQGEHRDEKEFRSLRGVSWKDDATGSRRKLSRWFNPETGEHAGTGIMANCETSNVVLIDLDTKNGKDGVAEWEELQQRYGAAPTPFTVTTPSGGKHLYYRQPENGPRINGKPGKERSGIAAGIDIKADSDAGAFLPPTIIKGSEGRRYQWDSFSGPTDIPRASELPEAPSWIHQAIVDREAALSTPRASQTPVDNWKNRGPREERKEPLSEVGRTLDRYKRMRLHPILQEDTDSNPSVLRYLDAEANYISALPVDGPGSSETNRVTFFFRRFVLSAQLDPEVLRERMHAAVDEGWTRGKHHGYRGIESALSASEDKLEPLYWDDRTQSPETMERLMGAFWYARPELTHIYRESLARRGAPWAVLGGVLAHVISQVPPNVVLPPIIGGYGSLNLYVVAMAASGVGKSSSQVIAREIIEYVGCEDIYTREFGTGQGAAGLFVEPAKQGRGDGAPVGIDLETGMKILRSSAIGTFGEISSLAAHTNQQASITMSTLLQMFMGEATGPKYKNTNVDLDIRAHTYRFCVLATAQTKKAGILLKDADAGLPQRFLWVPATKDPVSRDARPMRGEPLKVRLHPDIMRGKNPGQVENPLYGKAEFAPEYTEDFTATPERVIVSVAKEVIREIEDEQDAKALGLWVEPDEKDELNSHSSILRLRAAAALAFLAGRIDVTVEDWELAEVVMYVSARTQEHALSTIEQVKASATVKNERDRREAIASVDASERENVEETASAVLEKLSVEEVTYGELRDSLSRKQRIYLDRALTLLEEREHIKRVERLNSRRRLTHYLSLKS